MILASELTVDDIKMQLDMEEADEELEQTPRKEKDTAKVKGREHDKEKRKCKDWQEE